MKQTRWLTEAKQVADQAAVNGSVYYIMLTGDYTEFEDKDEGYMVVSAVEIETLTAAYIKADLYHDTEDYIADECLYATDDSVEPNLEPDREEVEHYLDNYTDHYQRDMPTGDYTIGLLFYAKVNPSWSGLVDDLLDQIRETELAKTSNSAYQFAVENAIEHRINEVYWDGINWAYECWEGQVQDDYPWIKSVRRVGRSGGHIKLIAHWPETVDELAEIAQDCATIEASIKGTIKWLESEEYRLQEYRAAFGIDEIEAVAA